LAPKLSAAFGQRGYPRIDIGEHNSRAGTCQQGVVIVTVTDFHFDAVRLECLHMPSFNVEGPTLKRSVSNVDRLTPRAAIAAAPISAKGICLSCRT
jgi:hypothetical protein